MGTLLDEEEDEAEEIDSLGTLLDEEEDKAKVIDSLGGCRVAKNMTKPKIHHSGGIVCLMALSGFMYCLTEVLHHESPTEVILRTYDTFTSSEVHLDYFCRFLVLFGYDMMCNIVVTLLSDTMEKLVVIDESVKYILFFWSVFGLERLFIDKLHVRTHKHKMCQNDENIGILHPKLSKFKRLLTAEEKGEEENHLGYDEDNDLAEDEDEKEQKLKKVNHQQVEQLWKTTNRMKCMRLLSMDKFRFALMMQREHHNNQNKLNLEAIGYRWEIPSNWRKIRSFHSDKKEEKSLKWWMFYRLKPWEEWQRIKRISNIERIDFKFDTETEYTNIWLPWDQLNSKFPVNDELHGVIDNLDGYINLNHKPPSATLTESDIEKWVCGIHGRAGWERYNIICIEFFNWKT